MRPAPRGLIVDMDGVLYRGERPLPGLREFFAVAAARPHVLVTNNSLVTREDCQAKLRRMGVEVPADAIWTVSDAAGAYLAAEFPPGGRALVLGGAALRAAVTKAGLSLAGRPGAGHSPAPAPADVVVVGLDQQLSYAALAGAVRSVAAGARFVAASLDPVLLTEEGIAPATGAIVAAIAACVHTEPVCVGKPSPAMFAMAAARLGLAAEDILVVGDSLAADIAGGRAAGAQTALLLSGVSGRDDPSPHRPDLVLDGLPQLSAFLTQAWRERASSERLARSGRG
jgi:HAD superfamily hydrolase (TIGR01450 family)